MEQRTDRSSLDKQGKWEEAGLAVDRINNASTMYLLLTLTHFKSSAEQCNKT